MSTSAQPTVKVQLVRSPIGTKESHRATVRGLGLRKLNSVSELQDTPAVRGMINKIAYLVQVVVIIQFVLSLLIAFNVVNTHNKAVSAVWTALNAILDPLLNPIRRVMPNTGGVDFSPMILIFGLRLLVQLLYYLALAATSV